MEDQYKTKEELIEELRIHQIELEMQNHELWRVQQELELARDVYFDLFELSPVGYVTLGDKGGILRANLTASSLLGVDKSRLISQMFSRFILKDDHYIFYVCREAVLESSKKQTCELRMVKKDGTLFHARLEISYITPAHTQPGQLRVVIIDATETKRLETELQYHQLHLEELVQQRTEELFEAQDKFKFITESIVDIVWMMDMDLRVTYISPSVERVMGYSPEERLGKTVDDIVTPESLQKMHQTFADELQKEKEGTEDPDRSITLVAQSFKKDGATVWLENTVRGIRGSNGVLIGIHGLSRDVTERMEAQKRLSEQYAMITNVFENAAEGICVFHGIEEFPFVRFTHWNKKMDETTGYTMEEINQLGWYQTMYSDPEIQAKAIERMARTREGEDLKREEWMITTKTGEQRIFSISTSVLGGVNREAHALAVMQDLTDRKKAEQENIRLQSQLFQSQKMEAVGTLAAGIAHDFNNMLQVILGYSDFLLSNKNKGEPEFAQLQKIVSTALEARDLVQKIRVFSRKADIQPVAVDLNHQISELAKLLSHTLLKTNNLEVHLADNLGIINADPALMDQMVTNLTINASEAMPDGGILTIETQNVALDDDFCRFHAKAKIGPHVLLTISDTGRGMTKELLDRIFDPFFSTKQRDYHRGTGLGLSIVKGIVDEHDGYITVESEVGRGTTFKIYFPILTIQDKHPTRIETKIEATTAPGETILLVEDEELVRDLGISLLEIFGYTVIAACDGQEAVEAYANHQENISLVILDIVMPRMDGRECLQELLKMNPAVKVLMSTGVAQEDRVKEVVDLGAKGTLLKPYGMKALEEKVREVLDAAG